MLLSWLLLYWAQAGKNYAVLNLYYLELPVISIFLAPILMWKELKKDYLVLKRNLMLLTMADNDRVVLKEGAVKFKEGKNVSHVQGR